MSQIDLTSGSGIVQAQENGYTWGKTHAAEFKTRRVIFRQSPVFRGDAKAACATLARTCAHDGSSAECVWQGFKFHEKGSAKVNSAPNVASF